MYTISQTHNATVYNGKKNEKKYGIDGTQFQIVVEISVNRISYWSEIVIACNLLCPKSLF